jgi:hypothetical protein
MVSEQRYRVNAWADMDSVEDSFDVLYVTERGDPINPLYFIRLEGKNNRNCMWFWVYREIKYGVIRIEKEYDFINVHGIKTTETVSSELNIDAFEQPDGLLVILKYITWRPV